MDSAEDNSGQVDMKSLDSPEFQNQNYAPAVNSVFSEENNMQNPPIIPGK